jgi:hypothetical protein
MSTYATLVARGCLCGGDWPAECEIHGPGDLRGIGAFFRAGMPGAMPMGAQCAICGADSLLYPNVEIDHPNGSGEFVRTLVCPNCSTPAAEDLIRGGIEALGVQSLNARRVFAADVIPASTEQAA